jgi:outer membrane protein OmpA-like peptidoglycan-associated protein
MFSVLALALAVTAPDERLVLQAPNVLGQQGIVRTTSALTGPTGSASLGFSSRLFFLPDFVLVDAVDADTFIEGNVVAGFGLFEVLELSLQSRAAANLNSARAQPSTSVGDTTIGLKGGYSFGLVAAGGTVRVGLPTRANKVGFDFGNLSTAFLGVVTVDLLAIDVPVRLHVNGGYTLQTAHLAGGDAVDNPFFLDGPDGALLALSTQQWFFDQVSGGLGVEVPLPYVTPFVELWYQAALGAEGYDFAGDAWIIATPGVRVGVGGLRIDLAADIGLGGTAGGAAPDAKQLVDGQPLNPALAGRLSIAHSFDLAGGGPGGKFERLEACVVDERGPVAAAVVAVAVDGQPGPRLLADDQGCVSAPVQPGAWQLSVSEPDHAPISVAAVAGTPAKVTLVSQRRVGRVAGFVTNKEDESIDVQLDVKDGPAFRSVGKSNAGAFDVPVSSGTVVVVARAEGYLTQGTTIFVEPLARRTHTFVMRKVPKKRATTVAADKIETAARMPFEFKKPRLQSTAEYLLDEIADVLLAAPALRVSIEAHTDPSEVVDATEAKALTEARALAVMDALVERGVDVARLESSGYGLTVPLAPNDPKNRRVEFVLLK